MRLLCILLILVVSACSVPNESDSDQSWKKLEISENGHYFQNEKGDPFFWLGDTGWLIFKKLDRKEVELYLQTRKDQGFNVLQVMLLHELEVANYQGDLAIQDADPSKPNVTEGNNPESPDEYDYWDHVEYVVDMAAEKGLWMGLVPIWGSPVKGGKVSVQQGKSYAEFLAKRFAHKPNIIWLNGGDVVADLNLDVWNAIGNTLDSLDQDHLITFHPRGRRMSSEWFHNATWLDFNMFQSGHRHYDQDTARTSHRFGPDNWKYVEVEYNLSPAKPTLDGEPSYEEIPFGLHDPSNPYWESKDLRRYAYWSVFAGGAGFTYGHNSVMQFYREEDAPGAYGAKSLWRDALFYDGARHMIHLKNLMLSKPYFERVPDQGLVADQGEKFEYQVATKGKEYAMIYTFTGRDITVKMGRIFGENVKASWYSPIDGSTTEIGVFENDGLQIFDPPGEQEDGNDWVLILDSV